MNKRGFGYLFYILILTALIVGFAVTANSDFNVNIFKENLNWTNINIPVEQAPDLSNALESLINGIGEAFLSLMKWVAQWSSENPTIPYKLLIWCVLIAIFAPILLILFKFIIILFILIKEWIQIIKERKQLKRLKYARGDTRE